MPAARSRGRRCTRTIRRAHVRAGNAYRGLVPVPRASPGDISAGLGGNAELEPRRGAPAVRPTRSVASTTTAATAAAQPQTRYPNEKPRPRASKATPLIGLRGTTWPLGSLAVAGIALAPNGPDFTAATAAASLGRG